jgi:hypothetical protein
MITLAIVLGFYISFNFALNLYSLTSPNLSFEVTEQNTGGTFSSLSRNFDQTIDNINDDENSTGTTNDESSTGTTNDESSTGTTNDESSTGTTNDDESLQ